ncbi:hypothetical protein APHAL10511_008539 [Amanita phalloides]|nr:hypothetical protein APHAL10511_008539 [Amanita phalloides]
MFWRFGFHNGSAIDSLLDKEDVSLEAILDEDDLLQECKAQNTRLIDYFQRVNVLQRLFGYVTGQIEGEERGRFKYPYVATEVLCSEIWSIVETCVNEQNQLLEPFWETVLDRSAEDMKTRMVMASHFVKINSVFLSKKPAEMLAFIKSQPSVVENLLRYIETPSFVDLLIRIIQLDEHPEGAGTLDWLSSQNFIGRLIDLLAPHHTADMQTIVAELIKNIIAMATPSPVSGITEGLQNVPASNRFARELAQRDSVLKLMTYILYDFGPGHNVVLEDDGPDPTEDMEHPCTTRLPTLESATSSVTQSISIIIELIRKNNSDYFEPYLFHTLRNRLIQVQQHLESQAGDGREELEHAMQEMVDRMGVVHFGSLLEIMCERMGELQQLLKAPRSLNGLVSTTIGQITPLTLERYRICELFAELLHCSNMSLLNRPPEYSHLYDEQGLLRGGLIALEGLAQVISLNQMGDREPMEPIQDEVEPALELPVHGASRSSPLFSSDDDMSGDEEQGSWDEDAMEEISMFDEPQTLSPGQEPSPLPPSSPPPENPFSSPPPEKTPLATTPTRSLSRSQDLSSAQPKLHGSRRSSRKLSGIRDANLLIGERLKRCFIDTNVLTTFFDLFFEFPWNNFLHSAVYDLVHQILTGNVTSGLNRELVITLFRDARIMHRIVEGQKQNDTESAKPKGVRLGYMGHLTLIAEDVLVTLERYPPDLREILAKYAPVPEWDEYVSGRYNETKQRDSSLLGGGKPAVASTAQRAFSKWQVDEDDSGAFDVSTSAAAVASSHPAGVSGPGFGLFGSGNNGSGSAVTENGTKSEFKRTLGHPPRATLADFGSLPGPAGYGGIPEEEEEAEEDDGSARRFASYLAQEIHSSEASFGSSSSDEEDEEGGWLSHSATFGLGGPSLTPKHLGPSGVERRPLSSADSRFDDTFDPVQMNNTYAGSLRPATGVGGHGQASTRHDPFNADDDDDDTFGPFSDAHAAPVDVTFGTRFGGGGSGGDGEDPFTFCSSSFSDDGDGSLDAFGDFGEFRSAGAETAGGGGYDNGHEGGESGDGHSAGARVEVVGNGGGAPPVNGEEFAPTAATTGSWLFAGSEDGSSPFGKL